MKKNLKLFLKSLNFNDGEIATLEATAPMLEYTTDAEAAANINLVVSYGYPAEDLTFLISMNPNFLCRNSAELEADLQNIANEYDDIETALKDDPMLI